MPLWKAVLLEKLDLTMEGRQADASIQLPSANSFTDALPIVPQAQAFPPKSRWTKLISILFLHPKTGGLQALCPSQHSTR